MALLSTLALYNFSSSIFDELVIPEGLEKDVLIDNILLETAELEILYSSPDTLKAVIGLWSRKRIESWTKTLEALKAQYNPIHNFDRNEDFTDKVTRDLHTDSKTISKVTSSDDDTTSSQQNVSAYNQESFAPKSKVDGKNHNESINNGDTRNNSNDNGTIETLHNAHLYGNIGVTKSQEMVKDEIDLRMNYNMYDLITKDFKQHFCLLVY